jgi:hypothetical protein
MKKRDVGQLLYNGGYEDYVDEGYCFTYTGGGGPRTFPPHHNL